MGCRNCGIWRSRGEKSEVKVEVKCPIKIQKQFGIYSEKKWNKLIFAKYAEK